MSRDGPTRIMDYDEESNIFEVTFGGVAGEKLSGSIESSLFGKESFAGFKIGKETSLPGPVWKEWKRLSTRASEAEYRRW